MAVDKENESPLGENGKKVALECGLATLTYPMDYVKVLIQIGHEPIAPRHTKTWLGKPALALPSMFEYFKYIKKRDGLLGLYNGLPSKILSVGVEHIAAQYVKEKLYELNIRPIDDSETTGEEDEDPSADKNLSPEEKLKKTILYKLAERLCVLIIVQPFNVLTVRTMAQFVGGEKKYTNPLNGLMEIWKENGLSGFWSGFFPRAIAESMLIVLTYGISHLVNTYVIKDSELKKFTRHFARFVATSWAYPCLVVSNCMTVSRSGLAAGYPPTMPFYSSWTGCWSHLKSENQLKRGSSLLFRYYTRPHKIIGGRVFPLDANVAKRIL